MEEVLDVSAHKYGNYHKYYTFHPSSARTSFFTRENILLQLWEGQGRPKVFRILDIGCNEGNLTVDVLEEAERQLPKHVQCVALGIDIDRSLIDLASSKYAKDSSKKNVSFKAIDFMDVAATKEYIKEYSSAYKELYQHEFPGFDIVCLFSITMWIHLNHGDSGLLDCLERSASLLSPTGSLVVEPQPWKCYKAADKRCRKLGITRPLHYSELRIRDIEVDMVKHVMGGCSYSYTEVAEREASGGGEAATPAAAEEQRKVKAADDERQARREAKAAKKAEARQRKAERAAAGGNHGDSKGGSTVEALRDISSSMGMRSYWDLGKEGWGRSILIFHRCATFETKLFPPSAESAAADAGEGDIEGDEEDVDGAASHTQDPTDGGSKVARCL